MTNLATSSVEGSDAANAPAELQLRFDCLTAEHFIDRHASDLSRGGIFVRSRERLAVGRGVRLDLQFGDGSPMINGEGTVFWTRDPDATRGEPEFGMGIRFRRLTSESQKMLAYLLAEKTQRERLEISQSGDDQQGGNERTVVASQEELLAAHRAGEPSGPITLASPAPAVEREPAPQPEALPEPPPPSAWTEDQTDARPSWSSRRSSLGLALGGIAFMTVAAVLIPILFSRSSVKAAGRPAAPAMVAQAAVGAARSPSPPSSVPLGR